MFSAEPLFIILGLGFTLMTEDSSAAAQFSAALTCSATRLPDGLFSYQLSQPPSSPQCETCWEDQNKTVIARDSNFEPKLIENLTNQSISLKDCHEFLLYTRECSGHHEEAHCRVNCSNLLREDDFPPHTVNSTLNCVFKSWCPDQTTVWVLGIVGIFALVVIVPGSLFLPKIISNRRRRRAAETTSYTPATPQYENWKSTTTVLKPPDFSHTILQLGGHAGARLGTQRR